MKHFWIIIFLVGCSAPTTQEVKQREVSGKETNEYEQIRQRAKGYKQEREQKRQEEMERSMERMFRNSH